MIFDSVENVEYYFLNERFKRALEFIRKSKTLASGNYEICEGVTASIADRVAIPQGQRRMEGHMKYADIQYLLRGEERIGFTSLKGAKIDEAYDEKRDVAFYQAQDIKILKLKPGDFMILFPQDLHMPQIGENNKIRKIVVKVLLECPVINGSGD